MTLPRLGLDSRAKKVIKRTVVVEGVTMGIVDTSVNTGT